MKPTTAEWLEIAAEDLDAAGAMLRSGRCLYAGFEAQQAAEKALKAVLQEAARVPPKIHNLVALARDAGMDVQELLDRLATLSAYYIATRYPEVRKELSQRTTLDVAESLLDTAREVLAWAKQHLTSSES
ncbi:MAG: HEPN domain-containing protein [Thermaerobacter sp.]|nr:HEPN domain-containing protein [Thermaerobacter sp.]